MAHHLIISIGRQIGAGGLGIARHLSEVLGIKAYDKELMAEVARESGLDKAVFEQRDELSTRGFATALQGFRSLVGGYHRTGADTVMTEEQLFKIQSEVMRRIVSEEDCIIVGRCADYILRDEPRLATFFICADLESRVRNLVSVSGKTEEEARRFIEHGDRRRAAYYNYYTFKRWGDAASYDLCIDASKLDNDPGQVVDLIRYHMKQRNLI